MTARAAFLLVIALLTAAVLAAGGALGSAVRAGTENGWWGLAAGGTLTAVGLVVVALILERATRPPDGR